MGNPKEAETKKPVGTEGIEDEQPFPIQGYLRLNLLFWAFCIVEILIIRLWLKDVQGVIFFFALLAIGFTLVSIYDGVYDRMASRSRSKGDHQPPASSPKSAS